VRPLFLIAAFFCLTQCSASAAGSTQANAERAANYVFSSSSCTVNDTNISYGSSENSVDLMFEKSTAGPRAYATNVAYMISGECVRAIESAQRMTVFLKGGRVIYFRNGVFSPVDNIDLFGAEDFNQAAMPLGQLKHERLIFARRNFGQTASVWRHRSGIYKVRLTANPSLEPDFQAVIIKSNLRLRSATFFPGAHLENGQVTLLQDQRDGTLKLIIIDVFK
jgi:hypothetical protein